MTQPDDRAASWIASLLDDDDLDQPRQRPSVPPEEEALFDALHTLARIQALHRSPDPVAFATGMSETAEPQPASPAPDAPSSPGDANAVPLQRWGSLEIRGRIGQGGFGIVYRAHDPTLDLDVALKLLPVLRGEGVVGPQAVLQEARLLARVRHPNVARVMGADHLGDHVGFWMELIEGRTLEDLVSAQGPLGEKEAGLIGLDLIRALAAVHAAGVLHRDIKARNVMRETGGRIVLMDFGSGVTTGGMLSEMTTSTAGTPLYLAPELFHGDVATVRSDLYSLGVLLYFLVTGSYPVRGRSVAELVRRHDSGAAVPLRQARPDLGLSFIQVIDRALFTDPQDRYADAAEMEKALATAMGMEVDGAPSGERRSTRDTGTRASRAVLRWGAAVALLAVIMWVVWLFLPSGDGGYSVDASLLRQTALGWERVLPGTRLAPRDRLIMEIEPTEPVHAYVLNWDDRGNVFLLFPSPTLDLENPLPGGAVQRLPGPEDNWAVSSVGGQEHFLIVASRERLDGFEETLAAIPAPRVAGSGSPGAESASASTGVAVVPEEALEALVRGVGWLESGEEDPAPPGEASDVVERINRMADELARSPRTQDVWVSKIVVENPDR